MVDYEKVVCEKLLPEEATCTPEVGWNEKLEGTNKQCPKRLTPENKNAGGRIVLQEEYKQDVWQWREGTFGNAKFGTG